MFRQDLSQNHDGNREAVGVLREIITRLSSLVWQWFAAY
jgi:hypothetical protein